MTDVTLRWSGGARVVESEKNESSANVECTPTPMPVDYGKTP